MNRILNLDAQVHFLRKITLILLISILNLAAQAEIFKGMPREEVIEELGQPRLWLNENGEEILIYEEEKRVYLRDNKVVRAKRIRLATVTDPEPAPIAPEASPQVQEAVEPNSPMPLAEQLPAEEQFDLTQPESDELDGASGIIGVLGSLAVEDEDIAFGEAPDFDTTEFIIASALRFLLGLLVFKLAFHFFGFPLLFRNLFTLSFAHAIIAEALEYVPFLAGSGIFTANRIVSLCILSALIYFLTDVKQGMTALQIAFITKAVNLVIAWIAIFASLQLMIHAG